MTAASTACPGCAVDLAHYINTAPDQRAHEPAVIDKRAQAREEAAANWWHAQGAEQRGDHVAAAQHGIARGRLLAAAKAEGLRLG